LIIPGLQPSQRAVETIAGAIHRDLFRWFAQVTNAINWFCVPPKTVIMCNLTAADVAASFTATGLGKGGGPYDGWAICNGNNGTDDLDGLVPQFWVAEAGGTASSSVGAGVSTFQLVPLMRMDRRV
jgi:hypothetical protein